MFYSLNQFQPRNPRLMSQEDIIEKKKKKTLKSAKIT